ncbi:hypothetical protein QBZ16_000067 [Prototheca wickerhamii]|uniref:Thioredoxin domain-containing protein n=1 Tax=Prototheca wickerhamii TaxID=3111 RepID=A0AAD9IMW9_PROWI|nr:hypothetical protein QBZ16_000067 [Prototheca wickerhamii]
MNGMVQAAIEQQLLRAAQEMEDALDAQIHALGNMDDDDLEMQQKKAEWLARGHGEVEDVEEKEFFKCAKAEERMVAHFYRASEPCRIMDMHLQRLAASHLETKFIRLNAEKSPFLTDRLKIWMLPTLAVVQSGKVTEYVVGFDDLGGAADFDTATLEARLTVLGAIHEDRRPAPVATEQNVRSVRRGGPPRKTDSDEDSDFD